MFLLSLGQFLGCKVDNLVSFFIEGLSVTLGTSQYQNDAFNSYGGPKFLLQVIGTDSVCKKTKLDAIEALSASLWDGHLDNRVLKHRLGCFWKRLVQQAKEVAASEVRVTAVG